MDTMTQWVLFIHNKKENILLFGFYVIIQTYDDGRKYALM